jgi:1,4-alpha-glucan branching enzyme
MDKTVTKTTKKRITFEVKAEPGSEVYVAGDFNNWEPTKKLKSKNKDGIFTGTLLLDRDTQYEYKFIINGKWSVDPNCDEWVPNALGSLNSVLRT